MSAEGTLPESGDSRPRGLSNKAETIVISLATVLGSLLILSITWAVIVLRRYKHKVRRAGHSLSFGERVVSGQPPHQHQFQEAADDKDRRKEDGTSDESLNFAGPALRLSAGATWLQAFGSRGTQEGSMPGHSQAVGW